MKKNFYYSRNLFGGVIIFSTFTNEQTKQRQMKFDREDCLSTISDLYKSAYSHRPRSYDFSSWSSEELEKFENDLLEVCKREEEEEARYEAELEAEYERGIAKCIEAGAEDRETAIRWLDWETKDRAEAYERHCQWLAA